MLQLTDYLLIAVLLVGSPLYAKFIWFPRMHALPEHGGAVTRSLLFAQTIIFEWALFAIALLSWQVYGRPLEDIGLVMPGGWRFFVAVGLGLVILVLLVLQNARGMRDAESRSEMLDAFGDILAMVPRARLDGGMWVVLSITAGVCEELLYRGVLLWYLLNYMPAPVAWVAAAVLFGWGHFYQGPKGMIQTAMVGAAMLALYVISGSLWVSMAVHVAIDVNSGLFAAWLLRQVRADKAAAETATVQ